MSEQPTAAAQRPAPKPPGKTYGGLSRNQWFIVGGVFVAAVGFILWRRHQAASAAGSSTAPTNQGSNECTDQAGNPVDCNQAFASELAGLQNSLDQLAQGGGAGSGGGGTVGVPWSGNGTGTGTGITGDGTNTPSASNAPGTPTSTGGTISSGTSTATAPKTAGAITGLASSAVTRTSFRASWRPAANASGGYAYAVRDLARHTQVTSGTTRATSVTVSGLRPGIDYNFGVQALPGGAGNNIHVRTA